MEFKWTVNKVQVAENNLIVKVDFTVTGTEGANTASAQYSCDLTRSDSFTPFEQLTEQQVLNWCFEPIVNTWTDTENVEQSITRHIKDEGEAKVTTQIAQKAFEPALPWL
jgi:hypothetical protein